MRRVAGRVFAFYWSQGIADDVPALTYYLLLSLVPFALGMAALEALLLEDFVGAIAVADQINRILPEAVHGDVRNLVVGAHDNSRGLLLVAIGAMLWTSSGAIGVLERCESRLLDTERHNLLVGRIRNVGLGVMVAVTVIAGAAGAPVIGDAAARLDVRGAVPNGVLLAGNTVGSILIFTVIYRYARVPSCSGARRSSVRFPRASRCRRCPPSSASTSAPRPAWPRPGSSSCSPSCCSASTSWRCCC
jgi:uncharacterized BrkB/YihY/UPF0761 family membrane protein